MPAIEISAMPEVAGMARSYVPAGNKKDTKETFFPSPLPETFPAQISLP